MTKGSMHLNENGTHERDFSQLSAHSDIPHEKLQETPLKCLPCVFDLY